MKKIVPILILLALAGCTGGSKVVSGVSCTPIVEYDKATQAQASKELATAGPTVQRMMDDYGKTRDAIRACEKHRTKG